MSDFKETCIWMSYRYAIGRKSIASVMHAEDIPERTDYGCYLFEDIFNDYSDYMNWIKLANLFLGKHRMVTMEFNVKVETRKMYEWWGVMVGMSDVTLDKRYSAEDDYLRGWYVCQEYIKSVL